jgi:cytochrome b6-f complex iron-sulfur subunit
MGESVNRTQDEGSGQSLDRRGFLKYILVGFSAAATTAGVATPVLAYLWPPKQAAGAGGGRVAVAAAADLPVGKGAVYSVNNKPVLVVHTQDGYRALSATCTHLGCIVFWAEQKGVIACPCHAAFFTTNGDVISGPAPAPLPVYRVQVEGDQIYVEGGQG